MITRKRLQAALLGLCAMAVLFAVAMSRLAGERYRKAPPGPPHAGVEAPAPEVASRAPAQDAPSPEPPPARRPGPVIIPMPGVTPFPGPEELAREAAAKHKLMLEWLDRLEACDDPHERLRLCGTLSMSMDSRALANQVLADRIYQVFLKIPPTDSAWERLLVLWRGCPSQYDRVLEMAVQATHPDILGMLAHVLVYRAEGDWSFTSGWDDVKPRQEGFDFLVRRLHENSDPKIMQEILWAFETGRGEGSRKVLQDWVLAHPELTELKKQVIEGLSIRGGSDAFVAKLAANPREDPELRAKALDGVSRGALRDAQSLRNYLTTAFVPGQDEGMRRQATESLLEAVRRSSGIQFDTALPILTKEMESLAARDPSPAVRAVARKTAYYAWRDLLDARLEQEEKEIWDVPDGRPAYAAFEKKRRLQEEAYAKRLSGLCPGDEPFLAPDDRLFDPAAFEGIPKELLRKVPGP